MLFRRRLRAFGTVSVATLIALTLIGSTTHSQFTGSTRGVPDGASIASLRVPSPLRVVGRPRADGVTQLALDADAYAALKQVDEIVLTGFHLEGANQVDLAVSRFDVFTGEAQILSTSPQGDTALPKPDVVLLRGAIVGEPESMVFLALSPHGSNGFVRTAGGTYIISSGQPGQPLATVVYNLQTLAAGAITWHPFDCGTDLLGGGPRPPDGGVGGLPVIPCRNAVIAVETDWEFTGDLFGGDTNASGAYAAALMGAVSEIYHRDLNATLEVGFLRLWSDSNDPWNSGNTIDQLFQFRDTWEATMSAVSRDAAHFLSGRGLGGGVAWLPGLCQGEFAYGLSANINGFFPYPLEHNHPQNWDVVVVAHELGHNFGAPHTHSMNPPVDQCAFGDCADAANGTLMSYCHTCDGGIANMRLEFHQRSLDEAILPYLANDAPCDLSAAGPQINQGPADQTACPGQPVTFSVDAAGQEPLDYQWRKDGGVIPGADQTSYSIPSASGADAGQYDVIVSNSCGSVISATATLVVVTPAVGDLNCDGCVNFADLSLLLTSWVAGTTQGDIGGQGGCGVLDGVTDFFDLSCLLAAWAAGGCP